MAAPDTFAIMQQIQMLIQGLSPQPYTTIGLEMVKDWTDIDPVCEIAWAEDMSEHFTAGGQIEDTQGFRITSAVCYTKGRTPAAAVQLLCACRDAVIPLFQQHAYLADTLGALGVYDSRVKPASNRLAVVEDAGEKYIVHEFIVEVLSTYTVPIGTQGI